ncbi:hypothetical protein HYFRA_00004748 [Hymenoscyphus fraxineus]|uniref:Uncharacterized protein n=1 Tax=Hymenoscyphus fraxineus TaxID=746836 RepID=A0A9N9KLG9_9HELO|nr:hypothetical protein HYFRA_00004748 [Hymenoscyphus fraxineus]
MLTGHGQGSLSGTVEEAMVGFRNSVLLMASLNQCRSSVVPDLSPSALGTIRRRLGCHMMAIPRSCLWRGGCGCGPHAETYGSQPNSKHCMSRVHRILVSPIRGIEWHWKD